MTETPQVQPLKYTRSEGFRKIYANSALLDVTPWDFVFTFGEMQRSDNAPPSHIENQVAITMSPQHAKALLNVMKTKIDEYEKHMGEIKLPQPESPKPAPLSKS
ncbi:MAG: DUF3467 domain-containing protein [Terriglobales bacterium]|jgi:hypothetical protein